MAKILVIVDMQHDFIDGSLGNSDAMAILSTAVQKINQRIADGWDIAVTLDTHGPDYLSTQEGQKLPVPHCIKDTTGWELHPMVKKALKGVPYRIFEKPTFGSESLIAYLKEEQPEAVEFIGLCTDICVVSNAMLLKVAFPETELRCIAKCCAGVTPESHEAALTTMKMCQAKII